MGGGVSWGVSYSDVDACHADGEILAGDRL